MFIHDALCDYITCGDTSVPAHELRIVIAKLQRVDQHTKSTNLQEQFAVSYYEYAVSTITLIMMQ